MVRLRSGARATWLGASLSALVLCFGAVVHAAVGTLVQNRESGLRTVEVGGGSLPIFLLHGYGSSPQQWLPFCETIHVSPSRRFVFPEAPAVTSPPDGPEGGRGWWRLDLASYRRGEAIPELSGSHPKGLEQASRTVRLLLKDVQGRLGSEAGETILGGFSQGAMIAGEIAFRTDEPLRALVILSGTFVDETKWTEGMPRRRGLPVFIAHGREDNILGFKTAVRLEETMRAEGMRVTWVPFEGGHEMPAEVVSALNGFLAEVGAGQ